VSAVKMINGIFKRLPQRHHSGVKGQIRSTPALVVTYWLNVQPPVTTERGRWACNHGNRL